MCLQEGNYYPGLWDRVMEDPGNSISEQGLPSAVRQQLANDDASVIVDYYKLCNQATVIGDFWMIVFTTAIGRSQCQKDHRLCQHLAECK